MHRFTKGTEDIAPLPGTPWMAPGVLVIGAACAIVALPFVLLAAILSAGIGAGQWLWRRR